jgi:dTDP-glucose 4,6-dehydratase
MIVKLMDAPDDSIEFIQDRPGHDRRYAVDWSKIKQKLDWKPSVSLEEGLKLTINWYRSHQDWWQKLKQQNQDWFAQYE